MAVNRRTFVQGTTLTAATFGLSTKVFAADTIKIGYVSPQTGPLAPNVAAVKVVPCTNVLRFTAMLVSFGGWLSF